MDQGTPEAFKRLLNSNLPPILEEQQSVQRQLDVFDTHLQDLDLQIAALEANLAALKNERSAILSSRAPYADILSARRRLPHEIISKIMELVCDLELPENDSPTHYPSTNDSPINDLMLVSRSWYHAACSTAKFWNRTHLNFPLSMDEQSLEDDLAKAAIRVRRASQLPLSFSLEVEVEGSLQDKIADFIKPLTQRISHFSLVVPGDFEAVFDLHLLDELFPYQGSASGEHVKWDALESLKLDVLTRSRPDFLDVIFCTTVNRFPRLQHLTLDTPLHAIMSPSPTFENLTSLTIDDMASYSAFACLSILEQCANLQCCWLRPTRSSSDAEGEPPTIPNVRLPYLTDLTISNSTGCERTACRILRQLETPSLRSFVYAIEDLEMSTSDIYRYLEELIHRSQCQERVRVLELRTRQSFNYGYASRDLEALFALTPNLEVLKLVGRKMDPEIMLRMPKSVKQLEIIMEYPWIDHSRQWFAETVRELVEGEEGSMEMGADNGHHLNASFIISKDGRGAAAARRNLADVIERTPGLVVHMD